MRVFDIKIAKYYSGKINKNIYKNLEKKVQEFIEVTPSSMRENAD